MAAAHGEARFGRAGADCRRLFRLEPLPPAGDEVQRLVEEDDGRTSEIEAVHWPHLGWTMLPKVEGDVRIACRGTTATGELRHASFRGFEE